MQNCDKLNKKGSRCLLEWPEILHSLNDFVKTNNEMLFLDYWLAAVLRIFSAASVTSKLYGHTRFTLFAIILRRGMKAYTSEKRDLSFRARPSPNRQNLDESVGNLVYKLNNYWK